MVVEGWFLRFSPPVLFWGLQRGLKTSVVHASETSSSPGKCETSPPKSPCSCIVCTWAFTAERGYHVMTLGAHAYSFPFNKLGGLSGLPLTLKPNPYRRPRPITVQQPGRTSISLRVPVPKCGDFQKLRATLWESLSLGS